MVKGKMCRRGEQNEPSSERVFIQPGVCGDPRGQARVPQQGLQDIGILTQSSFPVPPSASVSSSRRRIPGVLSFCSLEMLLGG